MTEAQIEYLIAENKMLHKLVDVAMLWIMFPNPKRFKIQEQKMKQKMKQEPKFEETGKCSICGDEYTHWGNNPEPIKRYWERCCDDCNQLVIMKRIRQLQVTMHKKNENR